MSPFIFTCYHFENEIDFSRLGFFTGQESELMKKAHISAVLILGEPFFSQEPFDFSEQNITKRIHQLIPTMLKYRLTPPPQETVR